MRTRVKVKFACKAKVLKNIQTYARIFKNGGEYDVFDEHGHVMLEHPEGVSLSEYEAKVWCVGGSKRYIWANRSEVVFIDKIMI